MRCPLNNPNTSLWPLIADSIPIEWEKDGDEWLKHLHTEFAERLRTSGVSAAGPHSSKGLPWKHLDYTLNSKAVDCTVVLIFDEGGLRVGLASTDEPSEREAQTWLAVIDGAFGRTGRSSRNYRWQALIGESPGQTGGSRELQETLSIGDLLVRPARVMLWEWTSGVTSPPSLRQASTWGSWPAVVEGNSQAFEWDVASKFASRAVHRLCVLLSLVLGSAWVVRESAVDLEEGSPGIDVPSSLWWQKDDDAQRQAESGASPAEIPPWLPDAWHLLESKPWLYDACAAYHEGLLLQADHPSFALIAFIAVIEAIGARLFEAKRCPECGAITGSRKRVVRTLELVEAPATAEALGKAYRPRSKTAHEGKLHGNELLGRAFVMPALFTPEPDFEFKWRTVFWMGRAASKLLLGVLSGSIDSSRRGAAP